VEEVSTIESEVMVTKRKITRVFAVLLATLILVFAFIALRIYMYRNNVADVQADAAIVLGAAMWGKDLSPVFRERVNHSIDLYRNRKVRKIIFTGGRGNNNEPTESAAARRYALENGVSLEDILIEESSHTTYENLFYAKQLADANRLKKVLIVSDPMHMKRAVLMAKDLGLEAYPSPTPTTRYQSMSSQLQLLMHETYYYIGYLMRRPLIKLRSTNT
jgi:uncharacterized SAM-binding protein YcdF (DUF218 family)